MDESEFRELNKTQSAADFAAQEVVVGMPVPAVKRVELFSPTDWEEFIEEWAHSLKTKYIKVQRYAGPGDKGCDVVGFTDINRFKGIWDNYQCKQYDHALHPSDVWIEIGKIIFFSFKGEYAPPQKYYFAGPRGIGLSLKKLLNESIQLKEGLKQNWNKYCENHITGRNSIKLEGDLRNYIESFDFAIFDSTSVVELIEGHSKTPYHATRFGGGLAQRLPVPDPPSEIQDIESRYVQQLMEAYSDHLKQDIPKPTALFNRPEMKKHFLRSRETFFYAESLRNFARDTVPEGTYEALQDEVYHGVIDTCDTPHDDGLVCVKATVSKAGELALTSNALYTRIKIQDKHGICHQLANEDRLNWVKKDDRDSST